MEKQKNRKTREIIFLTLITLSVSVPFCNQAFIIDDPPVIYIARSILAHPLDIYGETYRWGPHEEPLYNSSKKPLIPALVAVIVAITGQESEILVHLVSIFILLVCMLFFYRLTDSLIPRYSFWASLLFLSVPAIMVHSHPIMPDIAVVAFGLCALSLLLDDIKGHKNLTWITGGLALFASYMSKASALSFVVLITVLLVVSPGLRKKAGKILLVFFFLLAAWWVYCLVLYGKIDLMANTVAFNKVYSASLYRKAVYYVLVTGSNFFWLTPFVCLKYRRIDLIVLGLLVLLLGAKLQSIVAGLDILLSIQAWFFLVTGSIIVALFISKTYSMVNEKTDFSFMLVSGR